MISQFVLDRFNELLHQKAGIYFPANSQKVLEQRISAKIKLLGLSSAQEFYNQLLENKVLFNDFLDFVTTNLSYFYRESSHYETIEKHVLPSLLSSGRRSLRIWSAGCATGEEPYTLAMLLDSLAAGLKLNILATDISDTCLNIAKQGIYPGRRVHKLPIELQGKYMQQLQAADVQRIIAQSPSKLMLDKVVVGNHGLYERHQTNEPLFRVGDSVRKNIEFRHHNLCDGTYTELAPTPFDIIFCRNVLIYFHPAVQERVVQKFHEVVAKDGWLFLGHAEYISNMITPFIPSGIENTCYIPEQHPLIEKNLALSGIWLDKQKQKIDTFDRNNSSEELSIVEKANSEQKLESQALRDLRARIQRVSGKT